MLETSQSMAHVYRIIERISRYDVSVCLTGESGVGKTYLARKIHNTSARRNEPFVVVNCAAIPPSLLETELFGYERGAYTGARSEGKVGLIELAHNGTLFLDEIGEMAADMQVKLLSALQEKKFMRVGGTKERSVNFRLITATNQDLVDLIQQGKFRKDLFYRLYVIPTRISGPCGSAGRTLPRWCCITWSSLTTYTASTAGFRRRRWHACARTIGPGISGSCKTTWSGAFCCRTGT